MADRNLPEPQAFLEPRRAKGANVKKKLALLAQPLLLVILLSATSGARGADNQATPAQFQGVRQYIQEVMEKEEIPSVTVAVAKDGKIIWQEGFGWANREKMVPATPDTMYSLASISKPFTATGLMELVEAGKIRLDAPVNDYLGVAKIRGLAGDAAGATVRRVLSHTSGLPLHFQFFYSNENVRRPPMDTTIARYGILVFPPGDVFEYSNLGFGILSYVISRVSGLSFADYMRTRVFLPLGLTHTAVGIYPGLQPYMAERYDARQRPISFYTFDHIGASAIYSSAHDLVRFGMFHLGDHLSGQERILKGSTLEMMHQPVAQMPEPGVGYGLGWASNRHDHGYLRVSHNGGMPGVSTVLNLYPTEDLAIVVLTNDENEADDKIAEKIAAAVLPRYAAALREEKEKPPSKPPVFVPGPELLGAWSGTLQTWQKTLPMQLAIQPDGDIHVRVGKEMESLLNKAVFKNGRLRGECAATIPTPDASRLPHHVILDLLLHDGKLIGQASAFSDTDPIHYALSSYVELTKGRTAP
jgi:CubicO group peptidase (beta-lactamase class C family)